MAKLISEIAQDSCLTVELDHHIQFKVEACSIQNDRELNEDSYAIIELPEALVVMVADGLGGHPFGEWASHNTVNIIAETLGLRPMDLTPQSFEMLTRRALLLAWESLNAWTDTRDTTLTLAAVFPNERLVKIAHVGDCTAGFRVDEEKMFIYRESKRQGFGSFVGHTIGYLEPDHIAYYTWDYSVDSDWKLILHTDGCDGISTKKGVLLSAPALCNKASLHGKRGTRDNATAVSVHFTRTNTPATVNSVDSEATPASHDLTTT